MMVSGGAVKLRSQRFMPSRSDAGKGSPADTKQGSGKGTSGDTRIQPTQESFCKIPDIDHRKTFRKTRLQVGLCINVGELHLPIGCPSRTQTTWEFQKEEKHLVSLTQAPPKKRTSLFLGKPPPKKKTNPYPVPHLNSSSNPYGNLSKPAQTPYGRVPLRVSVRVLSGFGRSLQIKGFYEGSVRVLFRLSA